MIICDTVFLLDVMGSFPWCVTLNGERELTEILFPLAPCQERMNPDANRNLFFVLRFRLRWNNVLFVGIKHTLIPEAKSSKFKQ